MLGLGACGAAAGFLLLGVLAISATQAGLPPGEGFVVLILAPAAIAAGDAALLGLLGGRRGRLWFSTLVRSARRRVAALCWGVSLAVFAVWMGVILWMNM
jgi:hypothetical protein